MAEVERVKCSDVLYEQLVPVYMRIDNVLLKKKVFAEYERLWKLGNPWGLCLQAALLQWGLIPVPPNTMAADEYEEVMACQDIFKGL